MGNVTKSGGYMFAQGDRLRECRKLRGLTHDQLIAAVEQLPSNNGKTRSAKQIGYIENGSRPLSMEYAHLLAEVLQVRVEYLLLKDDFKTEYDRVAASIGKQHDAYSHITALFSIHGYSFSDVDLSKENEFVKQVYSSDAVEVRNGSGRTAVIPQIQWIRMITEIDRFVEFKLSGLF